MCLEKIVEGAEGFEWIWAFDATSVEYGAREEKWLHISSIAPICSRLPVHKEKVNKMKKKGNRKRKETYLFYWPHLFTTSNNLQVRNICTRMTNGNENENRFLGERSCFSQWKYYLWFQKENISQITIQVLWFIPYLFVPQSLFLFLFIGFLQIDFLSCSSSYLFILSNISWAVDI